MLRTLIFPVQDHRRDGMMFGVTEGYERPDYEPDLNFKNPKAEPTDDQQTLI